MTHHAEVDFAVVGVQKAGTRALRQFLLEHPEIGLSTDPEPHYFDRGRFDDTSDDFAAYHRLFTPEALARCTGDITPIYIFLRDCPAAMRSYNPDLKTIVVLRNPIERAYSQWAMEFERGDMRRGFLVELMLEPVQRLARGQHRVYSLVARGWYSKQLDRLFASFPPEQCLVVRHDDLLGHHVDTMKRIYRFLGVAEVEPPGQQLVHARHAPPMPTVARWLLRRIYSREIRRLERRFGWDLASWR